MLDAETVRRAKDTRTAVELMEGIPNLPPSDREAGWISDRISPYYAGLARTLAPRRILEVGVRLGYSLVAMVRGFGGIEEIVGVDPELHVPGSNRLARENILATGYRGRLRLITARSEVVYGAVSADGFDLVHVDGDHSEEAALSDVKGLWPALLPGGTLVVDDLATREGVAKAVLRAKKSLKGVAREFQVPDVQTGWWIAVKEKTA